MATDIGNLDVGCLEIVPAGKESGSIYWPTYGLRVESGGARLNRTEISHYLKVTFVIVAEDWLLLAKAFHA